MGLCDAECDGIVCQERSPLLLEGRDAQLLGKASYEAVPPSGHVTPPHVCAASADEMKKEATSDGIDETGPLGRGVPGLGPIV